MFNKFDRPVIPADTNELLGIPSPALTITEMVKACGLAPVPNPWTTTAPASTAEPVHADSFEKGFSAPSERRKQSLREYVKSQRALRVSDDEIIAFAQAHDVAVATELRAVIAEL